MGEHLTTRYNRASRNDALRISSAFHPLLTSILLRSYLPTFANIFSERDRLQAQVRYNAPRGIRAKIAEAG